MPHDKSKDPSTTSAAYDLMAPAWGKVDTLLGGTESMRAAGEALLPKHENEKPNAYTDRLNVTTLLNISQLTLDSWVGRPFSDPILPSDDVAPQLEELFDDIDMQGNALGVFARNWFMQGLSKAFGHVLIEHPQPFARTDEEGNEIPRTLADDRADGLRPFWSFIAPENLIFASAEIIVGREVLTHVRIREQEVVRVGFTEAVVDRIRVFDRELFDTITPEGVIIPAGVFFSIWTFMRDPVTKKEEWVLTDPPQRMDIDEIPIVTFYADRTGIMMGKSPIEDLVDLNVRHWQSTSDQISILTVGRFPMLAQSGGQEDDSVFEVGPKRSLFTPDPRGRFYYVEPTGKAIEAGRKDILDLEEQMGNYGADFLKKRPGDTTATAKALDSAEATSPLQDATIRFNDAINTALFITKKWLSRPDGDLPGTVSVSTEFGPEELINSDSELLKFSRTNRDISKIQFIEELKRRATLRDEFDQDQNDKELEEETAAMDIPTGEPTDGEAIDPFAEE